ncbi:SAM-dependent methyltransferase, partial [Corallococcus llansteffanensis]
MSTTGTLLFLLLWGLLLAGVLSIVVST